MIMGWVKVGYMEMKSWTKVRRTCMFRPKWFGIRLCHKTTLEVNASIVKWPTLSITSGLFYMFLSVKPH